jgi:transcriptional regulator with XRE-family HTH domain
MTPEKIKAVRARFGLTQKQFARVLNANSLTVSRWERGVLEPKGPTLFLLTILGRQNYKLKGIENAPAMIESSPCETLALFLWRVLR